MRPQPLPPGAVLLHIGPYKTGSTSLQAALFAAREAFSEHGVSYPGRWRRAMRPGWSAMRWAPRGRQLPPPEVWDRFAADIRARDDVRTCVSTEDFGSVDERADQIVRDLGDQRVHVVTVARRLDRLLPSAWQERVKSHDERTFSQWLEEVLGVPGSGAHRAFWKSQDTVAQAKRWLRTVPPERFHVVTTDDSDRSLLFRVFEGLLGLPEGLLKPTGTTNASLTANAAELLRQLNATFREEGWSDELYHQAVHLGVVPGMADRPDDAPGQSIPQVPDWAMPRVTELAEQSVAGLRDLGVDVIGELATLVPPPAPAGAQEPDPEVISIAEARGAVAGALGAGLRIAEEREQQLRRRPPATNGGPVDPLGSFGGRVLARELGRRILARVRRRR